MRALAASRRRDREFEHRRALDRGACLVAHGRRARGEGAVLEVHRASRSRRRIEIAGRRIRPLRGGSPVGVGERGGRHARRRRVVLVARGHRADPEAFGEEGRVGAAGVVEGVHRDAPGPNPGRGVAVALPLGRRHALARGEALGRGLGRGDGWGGAKGDGGGEGGYFRRQVRGRRGVCGGGGREVGEVGGGAAYRAQGLDRARAGRARRDGDRGFRARAFPPPRDATRSDGAGRGAREARRGPSRGGGDARLGAHRLREDAARARAASARGRGGESDSGTSHRRRPENDTAGSR